MQDVRIRKGTESGVRWSGSPIQLSGANDIHVIWGLRCTSSRSGHFLAQDIDSSAPKALSIYLVSCLKARNTF